MAIKNNVKLTMQYKTYIVLIGLFLSLLLQACNSPNNPTKGDTDNETELTLDAEIQAFYETVVAKHDEVMPLDSDIIAYRERLRKLMKEMEDGPEKDKVMKTIIALSKGHDLMADWMHNFKSTHLDEDFYKSKSKKEIMAYLKEEENRIEECAIVMYTSVEMAKEILNITK